MPNGVFNFGVGTIIGRRNGVDQNNNAILYPTPARPLTVESVDIEFDRTLKQLMGQKQFAVDIAASATKVTGKCVFAGMQANLMNDLFFGQTISTGASVGEQDAVDEAHNGAATVTIAPPGTGTFVHDLGVFYAATGVELTRVAPASEATGKYSVTEPGGVYTFGGTDVSGTPALLFSYSYTVGSGVTTMKLITLSNQLMGINPSFELHAQMNYPMTYTGVVNTLSLKLNACRASKYGFPFKNQDHTKMAMDFEAFADASDTLGTLTLVQ